MKSVIDNKGFEVEVPSDTVVRTVDGIHYLLTAEEKAAEVEKDIAWELSLIKRNAQMEIIRLEGLITPRRTREAILGVDNGWLVNQELLIKIERNKL